MLSSAVLIKAALLSLIPLGHMILFRLRRGSLLCITANTHLQWISRNAKRWSRRPHQFPAQGFKTKAASHDTIILSIL
ncbi:hypothetical protein BDZ89DRAFT_751350 [Hymenopellis radicata]|nr:hypothetical protein BDZ89DRAFT_751350 [Hymenopellis radicata]